MRKSHPTEQGDAPGKTESSQLKKITGDRDGKQDPEGLAFTGNNKSSIYILRILTQIPPGFNIIALQFL